MMPPKRGFLKYNTDTKINQKEKTREHQQLTRDIMDQEKICARMM